MSSYNAVNGVPSSANSFLLQTLLHDTWNFVEDGYVSPDCDSVYNVFNPHGYASSASLAAAKNIQAGTDIDCGATYQLYLNESLSQGEISRIEIEDAVTRFYSNLAAMEGIVLLKNDGILPLSKHIRSVALIGPWANVTTTLQGNYCGVAPYLTGPLVALQTSILDVNYAFGTNISSESTAGFDAALSAARMSDVVVFAGGIDNTVEAEGVDRANITWPGNQLQLIVQLSNLGKPVVLLQMGGGQVDFSSLKANKNVNFLVWGGYTGQSGGHAIIDILTGKRAPASRLTVTQYPSDYALRFPATDMSMRPKDSNPGRTYMCNNGGSFDIVKLLSRSNTVYNVVEEVPFMNYTVQVKNTGTVISDYTAMAFVNTKAGTSLHPTSGCLARTDEDGSRIVYPGKYELSLNNERSAVLLFTLTGAVTTIATWPKEEQLVVRS
ncbi:hypothetical protein PENCOP_c005G06066 [Penicillium coprophilum]|uniref:xylan 1,4-beta-xylosidase n=1 Tax=Penicillium coprophilum TaxID=36646 RepID=A0A1V6US95_9EURO|nr:hypothetical protein PENCOP_c005G06066 [Penicillium coprophilum]